VLTASNETGHAVFTVRDSGIGISPDDQPRIFDRFFRADKSRTRLADAAGTGLGLSICQAVVAAHGGVIRCQSRLHEGSEFVVEIPLARPMSDPEMRRPHGSDTAAARQDQRQERSPAT
jgi:signal transduction histidine kinase